MRILSGISLAALALAGSVTAAGAQQAPALVINDLNLRAGPTQNSPSLGVIPGGSTIPAGPCGGGWCQTLLGNRIGYVSQQYLDFGGPPPMGYVPIPQYAPPPPPPVYAPAPPPPVIYRPRPAYPVYPPYHRPWDSRRW